MVDLEAVGLVHMEKTGEEHSNKIVLDDDFGWFITDEFDKVRQDDYTRYHEYLENLISEEGEEDGR